MADFEIRVVARGIWLYDGTVPQAIEVRARPAEFAKSRWVEVDENPTPGGFITQDGFVLDANAPIPETPDGFVYYLSSGRGEFHTIEDAKRWADAQPWGPVKWE